MKKKDIYIQIGFPKTGTSSLQVNFFPKHTDIMYLGKYLDNDNRGQRNFKFMEKIIFEKTSKFANHIEEYKDELKKRCEHVLTNKGKIFLLSDEIYSVVSLANGMAFGPWSEYQAITSVAKKLKTLFKDSRLFKNVHIIIVFRKQHELMRSFYGQMYVKYFKNSKVMGSYEKYLKYIFKECSSGKKNNRFNYHEFYKIYADVFGKDFVHILLFEELQNDVESFEKHLSEILGVPQKNFLLNTKKRNVRGYGQKYQVDKIDYTPAIFKKIIKMFIKMGILSAKSKVTHFLLNLVVWKKYLKLVNTEKQMQRIASLYSDSNTTLNNEFDLNMQKYGYSLLDSTGQISENKNQTSM